MLIRCKNTATSVNRTEINRKSFENVKQPMSINTSQVNHIHCKQSTSINDSITK